MTDQPVVGIDQQQFELLMRPLNKQRVKHRSQGGMELSYLEAYDVRATLIRVFGFGGFSIETLDSKIVDVSAKGNLHVVTASAHVRLVIHSLECVYSEVAAATQTGPVLGEVADFALKTAVSDAMKRCAMNLGSQFGLGLYDHGSLAEPVKVVFGQPQRDMWIKMRDERAQIPENVRDMVVRATTPQDGEPQDAAVDE